jgi:hypothetical protein
MDKNEKETAHCLVYIVTNMKFEIQKQITWKCKNDYDHGKQKYTHTVAQRINRINTEDEEKK